MTMYQIWSSMAMLPMVSQVCEHDKIKFCDQAGSQ